MTVKVSRSIQPPRIVLKAPPAWRGIIILATITFGGLTGRVLAVRESSTAFEHGFLIGSVLIYAVGGILYATSRYRLETLNTGPATPNHGRRGSTIGGGGRSLGTS